MKIGIVQPYFFPYIGYFQLISAVDVFVLYDDVNFIKGGWINRNRFLINGRDEFLTVPCEKPSRNRLICETMTAPDHTARDKLLETLRRSYAKAPFFGRVFSLVESALGAGRCSIADVAAESIRQTCGYLGVNTRIVTTSAAYANSDLKGEARLIDICHKEKCTTYVNPPGGEGLYSKSSFRTGGIDLRFLNPGQIEYRQSGDGFVPWLSIVDVLMFNDVQTVVGFLSEHTLV